jgi:hypothetical protein
LPIKTPKGLGKRSDNINMYVDPNKKKPVTFGDVSFYFDGVASYRQDQSGLGRRNAHILALREKLLSISEQEFDAIISTMNKMVEGKPVVTDDKNYRAQQKMDEANMLYNAVNESHSQQNSVDEVSSL